MSATGRTPGLRVEADAYMTPPWCVERAMEKLFQRDARGVTSERWLDPCAGNGRLIATASEWLREHGGQPVRWDAVEIRPECERSLRSVADTVVIGDFLKVVPAHYDMVLTNPPYSLAEEFVRACLPIADRVVMLLRLNWLEKRRDLFRDHPCDVYVLPNRPSFSRNKEGKIGSDATAYAWFDWNRGQPCSMLDFCDETPSEVRSAYRAYLDEHLPPSVNLEAAQ